MIKLTCEPVGQEYRKFIWFVAHHCSTFSLVWKYDRALAPSTKTVYDLLKGHHLGEEIIRNKEQADRRGPSQVLRRYMLDRESVRVLQDSPAIFACPEREARAGGKMSDDRLPGLFSWVSPWLPENLTFYGGAGNIWLESMSTEEVCYLYEISVADDLLYHFPFFQQER